MDPDALDYHGEVTAVTFTHGGIRLSMYEDGPAVDRGDQVSVSSPVSVSGDPAVQAFDPERPADASSYIAGRLGQAVAVTIRSERDLVVRFGDGSEWTCGPDDDYEAWELIADGSRWISAPGGELTIFSATK
jgi:hypothetical protein